jgi:hypothetical protein
MKAITDMLDDGTDDNELTAEFMVRACDGRRGVPVSCNDHVFLEPVCGTAMPGTTLINEADEVLLVFGAGRTARAEGGYYDCIEPILLQDEHSAYKLTTIEEIDYCQVKVGYESSGEYRCVMPPSTTQTHVGSRFHQIHRI